ncbi:hypothetical protein N2152v2_006988 [Parachlorella kessleri]
MQVAWKAAFLQPRARAASWIRWQRNSACLLTRAYSQATKQQALYPASVHSSELLYAVSPAPNHRLLGHVEQPSRVETVIEALKVSGVINSSKMLELPGLRAASPEEVARVHSYVDELRKTCRERVPAAVADIGDPDGVTYVTSTSFEDALQARKRWQHHAASAAGIAISLTEAVTQASRAGSCSTSAFAITRPPGHHATADTPLGYCLFNNVALAARHAQQHLGLKKVFILDFDLHAGNGTCDIFYDDPSVLFVDTHERHSIYPPPFIAGDVGDIGEGRGRGATINIPLPRSAAKASMLTVFDEVIGPAAERFRPDLVLVSAGYDAHWRDPFQQLQLRSSTYHALASRLKALAGRLCGGRLVFLLEGGYQVDAVGESVAETFLALLGQPSREAGKAMVLPREEPLAEVKRLVRELRALHGLR